MHKKNAILSRNKILLESIKKHVQDIDLIHLLGPEQILLFNKLDLLILDMDLNLEKMQKINSIDIKTIINTQEIDMQNAVQFLKPIDLNKFLQYIKEKNNSSGIYCKINGIYLYDENLSLIKKESDVIKLTFNENKIISFILRQENYTTNKDVISRSIWNHNEHVESSTVEHHMYKLRRKIGEDFLIINSDKYSLNIIEIY